MKDLQAYLNRISPIADDTFEELQKCFSLSTLKKNEFFVREEEYARQIGFLQEGIVRAFFLNREGKEYSKQFFVAPSLIGAYTSLITKQPNKIAQQALTDCLILAADFAKIEALYDQFHDLERFPTLEAFIPQYYIASYLGISTIQLSRIRGKMSQY